MTKRIAFLLFIFTAVALLFSQTQPVSADRFPYQAYFTGDNVNVRALDDTFADWDVPIENTTNYRSYRVLGQMMKGDVVQVLDERGQWAKIKMNEIEGWTALKYLTKLESVMLGYAGGDLQIRLVRIHPDVANISQIRPFMEALYPQPSAMPDVHVTGPTTAGRWEISCYTAAGQLTGIRSLRQPESGWRMSAWGFGIGFVRSDKYFVTVEYKDDFFVSNGVTNQNHREKYIIYNKYGEYVTTLDGRYEIMQCSDDGKYVVALNCWGETLDEGPDTIMVGNKLVLIDMLNKKVTETEIRLANVNPTVINSRIDRRYITFSPGNGYFTVGGNLYNTRMELLEEFYWSSCQFWWVDDKLLFLRGNTDAWVQQIDSEINAGISHEGEGESFYLYNAETRTGQTIRVYQRINENEVYGGVAYARKSEQKLKLYIFMVFQKPVKKMIVSEYDILNGE